MKKPVSRILAWALLPIAVLAVMFGVELFMQRDILALPQADRTVVTIDLSGDMVSVSSSSDEEEEYYEDEYAEDEEEYEDEYAEEEYSEEEYYDEEYSEEAYAEEEYDTEEYAQEEAFAGLVLADGSAVAEIAYEGYIGEIILTAPGCSGQDFTITCQKADGSTMTDSHVFFASGDRDISRVNQQVTSFSVQFPAMGATIESIQINNQFRLNWNRMLLNGLFAAAVYLLLALRKVIATRLEIAFLIIALAVGLYMSIGLPANVTLSFDDQIHFERIARLSYGRNATVTSQVQDMGKMNWSTYIGSSYYHIADTLSEQELHTALINASADNEEASYQETIQFAFSDTGYLTQAAGLALGRALGLPFHAQFILGRVFNMLTYVALCYLAIRVLKRFKAVMMTLALMPTPMFLSCCYSYDPTINGLCFLGIALVMDAIMDRHTRLTWQRALGILLCLMIGSLTKIVYMPLLLLVLLLPRSKFDSTSARVWYKTLAVTLMLLAIVSMVLSVSSGAATLQDARSTEADSAGQISFILHNPFTYAWYLIKYLWENFTAYFVTQPRTAMPYTGNLTGLLADLSFWLMLFVAFTDNDPALNQKLNWKQRSFMFVVAAMVVGMVFSTMYVAFTPVGAATFDGVQGRYLVPMLPLVYMILSVDGVQNHMNKKSWHLILSMSQLAVLGYVALKLMMKFYA